MTTKTKTAEAPVEEAPPSAADRLAQAEQHLAELDHELRVGIPAKEREARTKMRAARDRGNANEAEAQRQVEFDLARRNNEIIRTLLPAAQMALAERGREARLAGFGVPDPDDPAVELADLEAAMASAEQALHELEAEAADLGGRVRKASQAGDGTGAAELWRRQQVLPTLVFAARARFLRARLAYVHTRANRPHPQMAALEEAAAAARAELERAQIADNRAREQVRRAAQEQSDMRAQVKAAELALQEHGSARHPTQGPVVRSAWHAGTVEARA